MATKVLNALRNGSRKVRHVRPTQTQPRRTSEAATVGQDGLTDAERLDLLVRYRATVGAKPAPTEEHKLRTEALRDKLQARPRPRPRPAG